MNMFWIYFFLGFLLLGLNLFLYARWRYKSEPWREVITRFVASNLLFSYIAYKIFKQASQYDQFPERFTFWSWLNWGLVMALFVLFLISYLIRKPAVTYANRFSEYAVPLLCSLLPFVVVESPQWIRWSWIKNEPFLYGLLKPFYVQKPGDWNEFSILLIMLGHSLTVGAMVSLKGAFSILTEARFRVTSGLYRYLKHPMYVGEFLATLGLVALAPSVIALIATCLFGVLLFWRSRLEEAKLTLAFGNGHNQTGIKRRDHRQDLIRHSSK